MTKSWSKCQKFAVALLYYLVWILQKNKCVIAQIIVSIYDDSLFIKINENYWNKWRRIPKLTLFLPNAYNNSSDDNLIEFSALHSVALSSQIRSR